MSLRVSRVTRLTAEPVTLARVAALGDRARATAKPPPGRGRRSVCRTEERRLPGAQGGMEEGARRVRGAEDSERTAAFPAAAARAEKRLRRNIPNPRRAASERLISFSCKGGGPASDCLGRPGGVGGR